MKQVTITWKDGRVDIVKNISSVSYLDKTLRLKSTCRNISVEPMKLVDIKCILIVEEDYEEEK